MIRALKTICDRILYGSALDRALDALHDAQDRYDHAKRRGDTRGMNQAWQALNAALHEAIRCELAMSRSAPKALRRSRANGWRGVSFQ